MSSDAPKIVGPDGRPARRKESERCPTCGAGEDKRVNTTGFGTAVIINCGVCGYHFDGATE